MKYMKERKFVKEAFENEKIEIKVSTITIIESTEDKDGNINYVLFTDRFGEQYEVRKNRNGRSIIEKTDYIID